MKTSKVILSIVLLLFSFNLFSQITQNESQISQNYFGEPRKPLETSFYSENLLNTDKVNQLVEIFGVYPKNITLGGIEKNIATNGKTIIIDANETAVSYNINLKGKDNIVIEEEKVFVEKDNRLHQIPIRYTGDNTVNSENFSRRDKSKLSEYVLESFKYEGSTPSYIEVNAKNNDCDIYIFSSSFIPNDISLKRFNFRTTQIIKLDTNVYYVMN